MYKLIFFYILRDIMNISTVSRFWYFILISFFLFFISCKKEKEQKELEPEEEIIKPEIVSFKFSQNDNSNLLSDVIGQIKDDTIFVRVFAGFNVENMIPELLVNNAERIEVDGVNFDGAVNSVNFATPVRYDLFSKNGSSTFIVKFLDHGLPAMHVTTNGQPITTKDTYVNGSYKIMAGVPGEVLHEGTLRIRGRGNSTWDMPKKPYRVRLDKKESLLGMPESRNWAIMANYSDRSLMRNQLAFEVSRRVGLAYTPRQEYVELFLNDVYQGLYNIAEHQEVDAHKIDIDEKNGGYYLEVDGYAYSEPVHFITPRGTPVTVKSPDKDDITEDKRNYITQYYSSFEEALFGNDFSVEGENGYRKYLDVPSFINYYLANEIMGNPDMLWSMKMYKKNNGDPKLYTGPVWDFDLAVNNDKRLGDASQKLMLDHALYIRGWIEELRKDLSLKQQIKDRWNVVKPYLATIPQYVDSLSQTLQYTQKPNFIKWDIITLENIHQSWYTGTSYEDYVQFLYDYLVNRINWLDQTFNSTEFLNVD